ncbi:hypothetical protein CSB11_02625 [Candidatus Campbellbacteria bacterium]|nr:MAG: hypothetical protein CSB11_02625 [Candidatus Campbellbacteria bacterium]
MEYVYITISVLIIILGSLSGILFINKKFEKFFQEKIKYFIAFSAGVFLMTVFSVTKEVFELSQNFVYPVLFIASGFLFSVVLNIFIPETHQHHTSKDCQHTKNKHSAKKVLIGDSIHNITDGLIIVPAFFASTYLGAVTVFSIFIHEFIQEVSEFFVLKKAGYSSKKALFRNFLTSLTIILGVLIALLISQNNFLEMSLLSFSAGIFLNIIFKDLLPELYKKVSKKNLVLYTLILILGFGVLYSVNLLTPHTHVLEDGQHQNDHDHEHE